MRAIPVMFFLVLLSACSSTPGSTAFQGEYLEIREVMNDDPLATPYETADGTEVRLGDKILAASQVSNLRMKQNTSGSFDLLVSLTGAVQARWRRFAGSRKPHDAALLVEGRILSVFTPEVPDNTVDKEVYTFAIPGVAEDLEASEALNATFDRHSGKAGPDEENDK